MIVLVIGCLAGGAAVAVAARKWRKRRRKRGHRVDLPDVIPTGIGFPQPGSADADEFVGDQGHYSGGGAGGSWELPTIASLADFEWPDFTWPDIEFPDIDFPDFDF